MTTPNVTSSTDSQIHNNIMEAGTRDPPPMLAPGRYPQWRSRFLRYVDTRPNAIPEHTTVETPINMSPENKAYFLAEKEEIHLILTGIGDEIYSTIDACQTAQEMWEAIDTTRFVTIVKQQHKLDEVSCHKLFDILKQYQNEVNELRAERLARNTNPLALVATAQANQDPYYQTSRSYKSHSPSSKPLISTRSYTTTKHKGKEIAKLITPLSETASEEDNDPKQAQRDKDMQKNLPLIAKYFKRIYKPTNNNLRTSSNSKNKNVDTTSRFKNDNQSGQFGNQRTVNVAGARENVGSLAAQQSGIQCFNSKEFRHFAKECRKPKRVKDSAYHKEKMLLCKQADYMAKIQEVPKADSGTDSELVEQVHNDAGYNVFANDLQHYEQSESVSNTCLVEMDDSNVILDSPDMCEDDIQNDQNDVESDDERGALANLIANLKLDVDENKKIQKKLKKANTTLSQELKECKTILAETIRESLENKIDELESDKAKFSDMYDVILQECVSKDVMYSYLMSLSDLDALDELQCLYLHKVKEYDCLAQKLSKQTKSVSKKVYNELLQRFAKVEKHSISLKIALQKCKEQVKNDTVCNEKASNGFQKEREQYFKIQYLKAKLQDKNIAISELKKLIEKGKGKSVLKRTSYLGSNLSTVPSLRHLLDMEIWFKEMLRSTGFIISKASITISSQLVNFVMRTWRLLSGSLHVLLEIFRATPTQAWLWHRRLSHLNFDYINLLSKKDIMIGLPKLKYVKDQLCSSCKLSKAKRSSFKSKTVPSSKRRLNLLHMDLCGPMRVASINGKKYILVIVHDYSRYTWTLFLRSKDETPKVLKYFLTMIQRNLQALVITV
nr:retrovirus-related Pol polyprotein from transposon TNT 1-94 [Tanacetum cinerariifolium]